MEKRLLLGIGPTRCGTTWLYSALKSYPEFMFSMFRPKESHILDIDVPRVGVSAIHLHFPWPHEDVRYLCDITPTYCGLSSLEIAAVAEQWPNAVIVAFVRDPVARAISGVMRSRKFSYLGGQSDTTPGTWQEAMALNGPFSRLQNSYDENITRWRRHFPETVYILNFDAIEHNPAASLNGLFEHLGMQWTSEPSNGELGKKVNRSSDIDVSVGADNELHLIDYWLSRDLPESIPTAVAHGWRKKWLERRQSLEPIASLPRARAIGLALSGLDLPYRLARQIRGALRAKSMRRALRA